MVMRFLVSLLEISEKPMRYKVAAKNDNAVPRATPKEG